MNRKLIYLAGGQQYSQDKGVGWRRTVAPIFDKMGFDVFDPTLEEKWVIDDYGDSWTRLKDDSKTWPTWFELGRRIINFDRDIFFHKHTDAILVYWDESACRGGGTKSEITWAADKGIPVYVVTDEPREIAIPKMPLWTCGGIGNPSNVVDTFEEAISLIKKDFFSYITEATGLTFCSFYKDQGLQ
jgi:hypothetical protein